MAARSVNVQLDVQSMPNTELVLVGSGLSHGEWSSGLQPPASLTPPVTSISWQSESDGFLTGTQGWVRYYPVTPGGSAPANPPDAETIYITWDDPFIGGNSYSSTAPAPYSISGGSILNYNADNDAAVFSLSLSGELQTSETSPALTYFAPGPEGSQLVMAYVATNTSNDLIVTTTDRLGTWSAGSPVGGQSTKMAPAITQFNGLALAYVANNDSHDLLVTLSKDTVDWSPSYRVGTQSSSRAPALAVLKGQLVLVYVADNAANDLLYATSSDGIHWNNDVLIAGAQSAHAPSVAVLGGELYVAHIANDGSHDLIVTKSSDLAHWTRTVVTGQTSPIAPSITAYGGNLVMVYVADNGSNDLIATTSTDGAVTWSAGKALAGGQSSAQSPALAPFTGNAVVLAYTSNDSGQRLITSTSADGVNWNGGTNVTD